MIPDRSGPVRVWLPTALSVAAFAFLFFHGRSICDDAYISFRYLDNWLAGQGLVYNPGEPVEGYTNFLWIVLLGPLRALGLSPEDASLTLSVVAICLLLVAVFRLARHLAPDTGAERAAVILVCGSVPVAYWAGSGMETVLFATLIAVANERLAAAGRHGVGSSVAFGLAALTRPTGALFAVTAFGAVLLAPAAGSRRRIAELLAPAAVFAAFPVAHLVFRFAYYGEPLPNTFYAKLGGDLPNLIPAGFDYIVAFLGSGGAVLVVLAIAGLVSPSPRPRIAVTLAAQVVVHTIYVIRVGGDYFPFARFMVPVVPLLAVLGAIGLSSVYGRFAPRLLRAMPLLALAMSAIQIVMALRSPQARAAAALENTRAERELVAAWISERFSPDSKLAINAAGVIPYRTRMYTIDMLGLNDRHIARANSKDPVSSRSFVGHFKHDGPYVCRQRPDIVLTSGARLHPGRNPAEAAAQAALNTFPGDRAFLIDPGCRDFYSEMVEELQPDRYVVAFVPRAENATSDVAGQPATAEEWFHRGVRLMGSARLVEAVEAFRRSLELNPGHPVAMTNLGFCLSDLQRHGEAVPIFEAALEADPNAFDALYGLALAREALGQNREAGDLFRRYIAVAPDSVWRDRAQDRLYALEGTRD